MRFREKSKMYKIDFRYIFAGDNFGGGRLSLQPKHSRTSLTSEEGPLEYRRKSAGSPNRPINVLPGNVAEPHLYAFDDYERQADGTVTLR